MKLIPLHGKDGNGKFSIVDDDDFDKLNQYHWYVNNHGYVYRREKVIFMHRQIMDTPINNVTDHINHDPLDNQKSNLRICTQVENAANKYKPSINKSGYKGVYLCRSGKFGALIRHNGERFWLGSFNTAEEAAAVYNEAGFRLKGAYHRDG